MKDEEADDFSQIGFSVCFVKFMGHEDKRVGSEKQYFEGVYKDMAPGRVIL